MKMSDEKRGQRVIQQGDRVTLFYRLALADGTEVDVATEDDPVTFVMGDGTLIEGLEALLLGMAAGETSAFILSGSEIFGAVDSEQRHSLPKNQFETTMVLEPGVVVMFESPSGEEIAATIIEVAEESVVVDFSHPLAGRNLQFEVEVVAVEADIKGEE
jgi:FKBP-type peptidyl-prolyl cis-trans isomerase SlpA